MDKHGDTYSEKARELWTSRQVPVLENESG